MRRRSRARVWWLGLTQVKTEVGERRAVTRARGTAGTCTGGSPEKGQRRASAMKYGGQRRRHEQEGGGEQGDVWEEAEVTTKPGTRSMASEDGRSGGDGESGGSSWWCLSEL
jgi:hypothetical protein